MLKVAVLESITLEKIDDHYSFLQIKWSATERIEEWKNGNEEWKQTIASCFVKTIHYPYKTLMPKVVALKDSKKVTIAGNIQLMLQSLLINFSKNQGVWACAVVNEREKYFLEKVAWMPCGHAATCLPLKQ